MLGPVPDAAWQMLLHLLIECEDGGAVTLRELCAASGLPSGPAKRWVLALQKAEKVAILPAEAPGDADLVALTPHCADQMRGLLQMWIDD